MRRLMICCTFVVSIWETDFVMAQLIIWTCARHNPRKCQVRPGKIQNQPGRPPSLIRVFAVRMKKPWVLSYPISAWWRLIWVFAGRTCLLVWFGCAQTHFVSLIFLHFDPQIKVLSSYHIQVLLLGLISLILQLMILVKGLHIWNQ